MPTNASGADAVTAPDELAERSASPREGRVVVARVPVLVPSPVYCADCVRRLLEAVSAVEGVSSAEPDPRTGTVAVTFDPQVTREDAVLAEVERAGFEIGAAHGHAAFRLTGLDCPDCARTVDKSVGYLDGVSLADLNFASGVMLVEYDAQSDPRSAVVDAVRRMGYGIEEIPTTPAADTAEFVLPDLDCPDCAEKLQTRLAGAPGVSAASVDFGAARLRVTFDPSVTDTATIARAVTAAGYRAEAVGGEPGPATAERPKRWRPQWRNRAQETLTFDAAILYAAGFVSARRGLDTLSVAAFALAVVLGGELTARRALASVRARSLDMNVLMTVAVIGAAAIGEWSEAAAVVVLFAIGNLLEARSLAKTRASIRGLMDLSPRLARVRRAEGELDVAPADVALGETLVVRPGERVALDAVVTSGTSAVDESPVTGESLPVEKAPGDRLYAGSLNTTGVLDAETVALAADSTLARIVYLVEEAQAAKAPSQRIIDRFTRWYTPAVVGLAVAVALVPPLVGALGGPDLGSFGEWFRRALVMLVVSCPCALVISTPVAVVSAITRLTRAGVLVKGGAFLEAAGAVRAVAFDKTGTLTRGRPALTEVVPLGGERAGHVLGLAAALEAHSTHPLARAVVVAAREREAEPAGPAQGLEEVPGRGPRGTIAGVAYSLGSATVARAGGSLRSAQDEAEAERLEAGGATVLVLEREGTPIGLLAIADEVRDDSADVVAALRREGIAHAVMLTGDNERTARAVAQHAGVPEWRAGLLPEDKSNAIRDLRAAHGPVLMVGDGVNDAPALAEADIGVAMAAAGSDTALETADVALLGDDLGALALFLRMGKGTVRVIRANVAFSIAVKVVVLVLAFFGVASLWMAVFADTGVSLLVTLNGLTLLRTRARD